MKLTRLVASTQLSERDFWNRSLLGKSLLAFPEALRPELWIRFENTGKWGLSEIYNRAIESCPDDKHLLFVHDDVFLHDTFLQYRIAEGLGRAEVIGLAGSRGSDLSQPSWGLQFDERLRPIGWQGQAQPGVGSKEKGLGSGSGSEPTPQSLHPTPSAQNSPPAGIVLSGAVSHISRYHDPAQEIGVVPKPHLSLYGGMPESCDLLDGLFLAVHGTLMREWNVRFDERLRFHLYDLDFCRTVKQRGMRLKTWPILVSHGSGGNFDSEEFRAAARLYLEKWQKKDAANENLPARVFVPQDPAVASMPRLIGCSRCNGCFLPENLTAHSAWHADEDRHALEELQRADSKQHTADSSESVSSPGCELSAVSCQLPAAREAYTPSNGIPPATGVSP